MVLTKNQVKIGEKIKDAIVEIQVNMEALEKESTSLVWSPDGHQLVDASLKSLRKLSTYYSKLPLVKEK